MKVEGKVLKPTGKEKYWSVEIPILAIHTQGKSEKDAYRMAAHAVGMLAELSNFKVICEPIGHGEFLISASDEDAFLAFVFRRLRMARNVTLAEAATHLGSKSKNAYGRYEQGKTSPTVKKLDQLIRSIDPSCVLVLKRT